MRAFLNLGNTFLSLAYTIKTIYLCLTIFDISNQGVSHFDYLLVSPSYFDYNYEFCSKNMLPVLVFTCTGADQNEIKAADRSLIPIIFLFQIKQFKPNGAILNEFEIATFICRVSSSLMRTSDTFIETLNILIRCK